MSDLVRFFYVIRVQVQSIYLGTRNGDGQLNAKWVMSEYLDRFMLMGKSEIKSTALSNFRLTQRDLNGVQISVGTSKIYVGIHT